MNMRDVAAIVTGGASGLGGATAEMLARGGASVAILDHNPEVGKAPAARIGGIFCQADVTGERSVAEALASAQQRHGVARIFGQLRRRGADRPHGGQGRGTLGAGNVPVRH